jgi:hypothetical protein
LVIPVRNFINLFSGNDCHLLWPCATVIFTTT